MPFFQKIQHCIFLILLIPILQACNGATAKQERVESPTSSRESIEKQIAELMQETGMKPALFGFYASYVDADSILYAYQAEKSLIPASTMKVVTTSTALEVLGADYRFKTYLQYDGTLDKNGTLTGNVYIRGGADPSLGIDDLEKLFTHWAAAISKKGIKNIKGRIVGDASILDDWQVPATWVYEDLGNYYGAGASGLSIHENMFRLYFKTGKTGSQSTYLHSKPKVEGMTFVNEIKAQGTRDNAYIYGAPFTYLRYMRGEIPPNRASFAVKGAIPDPALFAAQKLHATLAAQNISIGEKPSSIRLLKLDKQAPQSQRTTFDTLQSAPLPELVKKTNLKSKNLYAELFLKMLGVSKLDKGTQEAGVETLINFWKTKGLDTNGFLMEDGSGLSRYNAITTAQLGGILKKMGKGKHFNTLYESMPIAGRTGSMRRFGKGTRAEGNLRAKSGYLSKVKSYAGYVKTRSGKYVAFAMLANHFSDSNSKMNKRFEKLMVLLAELP